MSNVIRFLMLHHNSNTTLRSIFATSIPILILSSNHPKCPTSNKACKWLLLSFCFENLLSQIAILEGMTSIFLFFFCQSFMRCGQLAYYLSIPPLYCHASYNDLFSHSCLKVSTNSCNLALHALLLNVVNPNFITNLSNQGFDIDI